MEQNLFNWHDEARSRNSDPDSSHIAADKMNSGDTVTKHQRIVLELISQNDGLTAKQLGIKLAKIMRDKPGSYEWPRKRSKELATKLLIERKPDTSCKELRLFITDRGKKYLTSQK